MLRLRWISLIAAAGLASSCAATQVSSHVDRAVNFGEFITYDWGAPDALPTGDPRLDNNPFFIDYLTGAVERQLAERGYRLAETGEPQLRVHFHANVSRRFEVHGLDNYPACAPNCEPAVAEYDEGTIVIDIVDAATNRLVWRGWVREDVNGLLASQDRMQRTVERGVSRLFEEFPKGGRPATAVR